MPGLAQGAQGAHGTVNTIYHSLFQAFKGSPGTEKLMAAKLLCLALGLPKVLSMAF